MSEVELAIEAESEARVFEDAFEAFAELVGDGAGDGDERRDVSLAGDDRAALLVDWLEELVYLADVQQFVPERIEQLRVHERTLTATVVGHLGDPRSLVKAVTRHDLAFEARDGGWRARVVLDV
jgi:SHS2 domain-containing protein